MKKIIAFLLLTSQIYTYAAMPAQYLYDIELHNKTNKTVYYDIRKPNFTRMIVLKSKLRVFKGTLKSQESKFIQAKQPHNFLVLYHEGWLYENFYEITPAMANLCWTDRGVEYIKRKAETNPAKNMDAESKE